MLVRVLTDTGGPKPCGLLAKVIEERERDYVIQFLSRTDEKDRGRVLYQYEDDTYTVDDDYIIEYFDDESDAGFIHVDSGWVKQSADADYEPDSSDELSDDAPTDEEDADDEDEEYYDDDDDYGDDDE